MKRYFLILLALLSLSSVQPADAQLGTLFSFRQQGEAPEPPDYDSDAIAIWTAFGYTPDNERRDLINAFVVAYKSAGLWAKRDVLWVMAAEDTVAARINWKNPGTFTLVGINSPTFTADEGYMGNGSNMYINTTWIPSTHGVTFTQNAANYSVYTRSTGTTNALLLGAIGGSNVRSLSLLPRLTADNKVYVRINNVNTTSYSEANPSFEGHYSTNRSSSTNVTVYKNGSTLGNQSKTSDGVPTIAIYFLCANNNGTAGIFIDKQISIVAFGGSLTATEIDDEKDIFEAYMDGLGTGVIP